MPIEEPIDWLKATEEDRQRLYAAAKAVKDMLRIEDWNDFLKPILSISRSYSDEYERTFSRGTLGRKNALEIYIWIAANYLNVGRRVAPDIFPAHLQTRWDAFVETHGVYGALNTANPEALGLTQRDGDLIVADHPIKFKQAYCFHLKSNLDGLVIALESHEGGEWHPIPLGADSADLAGACKTGSQYLPINPHTRHPFTLREHKDDGLRQFVFLVGQTDVVQQAASKLISGDPVHRTTLNEIAYLLEDSGVGNFEAHCHNVYFEK